MYKVKRNAHRARLGSASGWLGEPQICESRAASGRDDTGKYLNVIKAHGAVAYADPAGLVDFIFAGALFVKAWQGHADSQDAAVSASLNKIQQRLATFEEQYHMDYKLVPVAGTVIGFDSKVPPGFKPIPSEFRCEPLQAMCRDDKNTIDCFDQ